MIFSILIYGKLGNKDNLVLSKPDGTYTVDTTQYKSFYITFLIANGAVKIPLHVLEKANGSRFRVAFGTNVYADVTINTNNIVIAITRGDYEGCSVSVVGLLY